MLTNMNVYRSIAVEAEREARRLEDEARTSKPDGTPGYVIAHDPDRRSFKQSLIAIAFSGIYLEALLFVRGTQRFGSQWLKEFDRKTYEDKLMQLGITTQSIIQGAKHLRQVRNDFVHEKAVPIGDLSLTNSHWAQVEATAAVHLLIAVDAEFNNALPVED